MTFLLHTLPGQLEAIEYLPCSAITPKIGMALYLNSGGQLAIATGTTKPTYISLCERETSCVAGDIIPVLRIDHSMVFETSFSASPSSIKLGNLVTLHASNGMQVTATTTNGVAEVVYKDGNASGAMCRVRF